MFTLLHSSTNQELLEKYICNLSRNYENMDGAVPEEVGRDDITRIILHTLIEF